METLSPTPAQKLQAERLKYPGLIPQEVVIFRAWLRLHESEYDRFDYNYLLGAGTDPGTSYPQNIRDMAIHNSRKRADAIAWKGTNPTIIEVKYRATVSVVGQIAGYYALWLDQHPNTPEPALIVACKHFDNDVLPITKLHRIGLDVVNADMSELRARAPQT